MILLCFWLYSCCQRKFGYNFLQNPFIEMNPHENKIDELLCQCETLIEQMFEKCRQNAPNYEVSFQQFKSALEKSVKKYLVKEEEYLPDVEEIKTFLGQIHYQELFLAIACANGDERAWWDFDREYRSYIEGITRKLAGSESNAEEAISALYYELYGSRIAEGKRVSKFLSYSGRGSLRSWLKTIIWHSLVDLHRSWAVSVSIDEMVETVGEGHAHALLIEQDSESDILDELTRKKYLKKTLQAMENTFSQLADHEKLILFYYYTEKLTLGQIARIVELPESPLRSWFKRKTERRQKEPSSRIHESTIMRWLEKTYSKVSNLFREELKKLGLKQQEIETCIKLAAEAFSNFSSTEKIFGFNIKSGK
jgi:RNA polymerase sigma factor (sigma-70 family)